VAAIHAAGADLGDPVEITRNDETGRVVVSMLAGDEQRHAQIRSVLTALPFAELRVDQPDAVRRALGSASSSGAGAESMRENRPFQERLASQLGSRESAENFTNHVMDLSEAALARAHALRSLARRFPPAVEAQFTQQDLATLRRIQEDHTRSLTASVRQVADLLRTVSRDSAAGAAAPDFRDWREGAEEVLNAARALDRAVSTTLAGNGAPPGENAGEALKQLSRTATDLQSRAASLQTVMARSPG